MSEEIIDLKDVLERVQDDKELLDELFDIYQEDFVIKRKALGDAIAANDIAKIKEDRPFDERVFRKYFRQAFARGLP